MGLVVLLSDKPGRLALGPEEMAKLAALGVTSAALVRDADTVGLVLEGWAFDGEAGAEAAAAAVGGSSPLPHRTLRPLVQMAVSATAPNRRSSA